MCKIQKNWKILRSEQIKTLPITASEIQIKWIQIQKIYFKKRREVQN